MKRIFTLFIASLLFSFTSLAQQATGINFSSSGDGVNTSLRIRWTNGTGVGRIVVVRNAVGVFNPIDNSNITGLGANANFSSATDLDGTVSGVAKVVMAGVGTQSVLVSNLVANTQYYVQIFEYTGSNASPVYIRTTNTTNPLGLIFYTANGSFNTPPDVSSVTVQAWGGGAGGGTGASGNSGSGGGGGAYASGTAAVAFASNPYAVVVGTGGAAGDNAVAGVAGNPSSFNATSIVALGGEVSNAGTVANGGQAAGSTGNIITISGGNGGAGDATANRGGGGGGSSASPLGASANGAGNGGTATGGAGGNGPDGDGGKGGDDNTSNSSPGTFPGGGGGGRGDNGGTGGAGAPGLVIVSFTEAVAPAVLQVGAVTPKGNNEVNGYWNATNTTLEVVVLLTNTDASLDGGSVQVQIQNTTDVGFVSIPVSGRSIITNADRLAGTKTVIISAADLALAVSGQLGFKDGLIHEITAVVSDAFGNSTPFTKSATTFTVDVTPPGAPSVPDLVAASDSGPSSTDNITNDNTPTFSVTGVAGLLLEILEGSNVIAFTNSATGAAEELTASILADNTYSIRARVTDAAGNRTLSAVMAPNLQIIATPPTAPSAPSNTITNDTGASTTDRLTSDSTPQFTNASAGTNGDVVSITSDLDGNTPTATVAGGNYSIVARIAKTGSITSNTGSTAVTGVGTDFVTELAVGRQLWNAAGTSLVGTIAAINNATSITLTANAATTLAGVAYSAGLREGTHTITATKSDLAGNTASSASITVTIDFTAPNMALVTSVPVITGPTTGTISRSGTITCGTGSSLVNGVGTSFTTELVVGAQIRNLAGALIGTVASIANDTQLTLAANAAVAVAGAGFTMKLYYTVTFPEAMQNSTITTADFAATGATATIDAVTPINVVNGASSTFIVSVGVTGTGNLKVDKTSNTASDAAGNATTATFTGGTTANVDNTGPTLTLTRPAASTFINNGRIVTYTIGETINTGTITYTRTGGTADANSPHPISLTGAELSANQTDYTLTNNFTNPLVSGTVYTVSFSATDALGNVTTVNNTGVTFDTSPPAAPAAYNAVTSGGNVVANYWNSHNTGVTLAIAIPNQGDLLNGFVEVEAGTVASGTFATIATTSAAAIGAINTTKNITINAAAITAISGYGETQQLRFRVRIVDQAGNVGSFTNSSNTLTVDTTRPTIFGTPAYSANGSNRETIVLNFSETLGLANGAEPVNTATNGNPGFYTSQAQIRAGGTTAYASAGNTITLQSDANGQWTSPLDVTYTSNVGAAGNYVRDIAGNEMDNVTLSTNSPAPNLASSMVLDPNGAGNEIITFSTDVPLNTPTTANAVTGITVDGDGAGPGAPVAVLGTYNPVGNIITLNSSANNQWTSATTVSYSAGNLASSGGTAMAAFGPEPILLAPVSIASNNATSTLARPTNTVTVSFTANSTLSVAPVVTIGGLPASIGGTPPNYTATVTTDNTLPDGPVTFSITAEQTGRSTIVTKTIPGTTVTFDKTAPVITPATIVSNNANTAYARPTNTVTVSFTVNETLLSTPTVTIDGKAASVTNIGLNYTATVTTDNTYTDGVLAFSISVTDLAGNTTVRTTTTNGSSVIFDKVAPVVASITRTSPLKGIGSTNGIVVASGGSVTFDVVFTETNTPLTGINDADFEVITDGTVAYTTIGVAAGGNANTRTVTVNGLTGYGRIALGVRDDDTILDAASNPLNGAVAAAYVSNQYYTLVLPEPNNEVFTVTESNITSNSVTLTWSTTNNPQAPTNFLILARPTTGPGYPSVTDGIFISDGPLAVNVARAATGTNEYVFTGLNSGTSYDFRIYKYTLPAGVSNDNIDFETSAPSNRNGVITISASLSTLVLTSTPVSIGSIKNAQGNSEKVMEFEIFDDGRDPISPNYMTLNLNGTAAETIVFTLRDELTLLNNSPITGFTVSSGVIASAIYSGKGTTNTITLTRGGIIPWNENVTVSYSGLGNMQFINLGRVQPIVAHPINKVTGIIDTYTANGIFSVPTGVTNVTVEAWGGGGAGGAGVGPGPNGPFYDAGGGGGGGGYSRSTLAVTSGSNFSVVVGGGGVPVFGNGGSGGNSNFGGGIVVALGGLGGVANDGGNSGPGGSGAGLGTGDDRFIGGTGSSGLLGSTTPASAGPGGGGGSSAGTNANGTSGDIFGSAAGAIAPPGGGNGGNGINIGGGGNGTIPGGGGGGSGNGFGGSGARGQIVITYDRELIPATSDWAADNSPFKFNQLVVTQVPGIPNSTLLDNWADIILGAELSDANNPGVTPVLATLPIGATSLTFSSIPSGTSSDLGYVPDANGAPSSRKYALKIWLRNDLPKTLAEQVDGLNLAFQVATGNFTYDDVTNSNQRSSRFISTQPLIQSGSNPIAVVASKLVYHTPGTVGTRTITNPQPAIGVNIPFSLSSAQQPEVYALDANNNLDLNYNNAASVSNSQGFNQLALLFGFNAGKLVLSPFTFTSGSPIAAPVNTQIVVNGTGTPVVTDATSTNIAPVISGLSAIAPGPATEPASFSSLTTALSGATAPQLNAGVNFDFTITDDVSANNSTYANNDGLSTQLTQIVITQGAGTTAALQDNWDKVIQGAELTLTSTTGTQTGLPLVAGTATIGTNTITISGISAVAGRIDDDRANTYSLRVFLKNPVDATFQDVIDKKGFEFVVSDVSIDETSSQSTLAVSSSTSGATNNRIEVSPSRIDFSTQWLAGAIQSYDADLDADAVTGGVQSAVIKMRDINQNLDLDYNSNVTINSTSLVYTLANNTGLSFNNGQLTLSGLQVTSAGGGPNGGTTRIIATSGGFTSDAITNPYRGNTFELRYSQLSDIARETSFAYPTNIDYASANNQTANITGGTGIALERFKIRDGGGTVDADGTGTSLSSVTIRVTNYQLLRKIALYEVGSSPGFASNNELIELDATLPGVAQNIVGNTADFVFSGITGLTAPDNGTRENNFIVKASFRNSNITDNATMTFEVIAVSAASVGSSGFANPNPTGTISAITGDQNKIEVIATVLNFTTVPATASVNVSFPVQVQAQDAFGMLDLDYNGTVSFSGNGNTANYNVANLPTGATFAGGILNYPNDNPLTTGTDEGFYFVDGTSFTQLTISGTAGNTAGSTHFGPLVGTSAAPGIEVRTSFDSWLFFDPTASTYTPRINFVDRQEALITATSQQLGKIILHDGGSPYSVVNLGNPAPGIRTQTLHNDDDGAFTKIDNFKIHINVAPYIRRIALYAADGTTKIGSDQTPDGAGEVTFTGLANYFAPDNGSYEFTLRASFTETITDLDPLVIQIRSVAHNSGSKFAEQVAVSPPPSIAGVDGAGVYGDSSPTSVVIAGSNVPVNIMDVVATSLDFVTQPSAYAGIDQPIDATTDGNTGIVHARDRFTNLDTEFNFTYTLSTSSATPVPSAPSFTGGILDLTGMQYSSAGDGTLEVIANSISSNTNSSPNSIDCNQVDVLHVTAIDDRTNGVEQSESLKGGTTNKRIFGLSFSALHSVPTDNEPELSSFSVQFIDNDGNPYPFTKGPGSNIYKNFRLAIAEGTGAPVTLVEGVDYTLATEQSAALASQIPTPSSDWRDKLKFVLTNPAPLHEDSYKFYINVDIDVSVSVGTPAITPIIVDQGYGRPSNDNIIVSKGSSATNGIVRGITRKFASTKPPILVSTSPKNGTLNVNLALNTIQLQFDVPVVTFDGIIKVYNRETGTLRATFTASNGKYVDDGTPLAAQTVPILNFEAPTGFDFKPDTVYYVTIEKGVFSNTDPTERRGISDEGFNLYGGISYNGTFYFKGSSLIAPRMEGTDATKYYYTPTTATFNARFDRPGILHYLVVHPSLKSGLPATAPARVTNAQILDPSLYLNTDVVASGSTIINQQSPNFQYITINATLTSGVEYFVYIFAENDADPIRVATTHPYGSITNAFAVNTDGPTLKIRRLPATTVNINNPRFEICPNSSVRMEEPIIISEISANSEFRFKDIVGTSTLPAIGLNTYSTNVAPAIGSYGTNALFLVSFASGNTGPATINLNGLGARIITFRGAALSPGDIVANKQYFIRYNGASFELSDPETTVQTFNILLPTGFLFDITKTPTVKLNGNDFVQTLPANIERTRYRSSTLLEVNIINNGSSSFDNIIIEDLFLISSSNDISGNIIRFGGNALTTIADDRTLARITSSSAASITFTNSYELANAPWPYTQIKDANPYKPITYIPNNFGTTVRLIPQLPVGDYGSSFFSGSGLTNDELTLSAVALNAAFNITLTHTDQNGCQTTTLEQYQVYNHQNAIPELLRLNQPGVSYNISGTKIGLIAGAPDATTNVPGAPSLTFNVRDSVSFVGLAGYQMIDLFADIPVRVRNNGQVLDYATAGWQNLVRDIPRKYRDYPVANLGQVFKTYNWEYSQLINQTATSAAGVQYPYDPNGRFARVIQSNGTGNGKTFFEAGSLGIIEFTGVYQSTADFSVFIPFRQEVEVFIPAVPIVEVQGQSSVKDGEAFVFCESGLPFTVTGYPLANSSDVTGSFVLKDAVSGAIITDPGFIDNANGTATFNPTRTVLKNSYKTIRIEYTFKQNNSPAVGTGSVIIRITPTPVAEFTTSTLCENIDVQFTDATVNPIPGDVTIAEWTWSFGDANSPQNSSTLQNPIHVYRASALYAGVSLSVKTNFGCASIAPAVKDLQIGGTPTVAFGFEGVSVADPIVFTNGSRVSLNDSFGQLVWTYGDGQSSPAVTSNFLNPNPHTYTSPGIYNVKLDVTSAIGCVNSLTQQIIVLGRETPTSAAAYDKNFETSGENWIGSNLPFVNLAGRTNLPPSSWASGAPSFTSIIEGTPNTSNMWKTNLTGPYAAREQSALYSPSFDLSGLVRPMISFNAFAEFISGDGVVIQYSTDNKNAADPLKAWIVLGAIGNGVDWYTDANIAAKPGDQSTGDFGWSFLAQQRWLESKLALTNLAGNSKVVFRFALASTSGRAASETQDGFAMDNFRLGERTRTILLESFANTSNTNSNERIVNDFIRTFGANSIGTDVVKLNYHVGFPGMDPFNQDNQADPSSRALYYEIAQTPKSTLDGQDGSTAPTQTFRDWGQRAFDSQTLQLANADIFIHAPGNIALPPVIDENGITFQVTVNAKSAGIVANRTILHTAVLEQTIPFASLSASKQEMVKTNESQFDFVVKKMIPSASGTRLDADLPGGTSRTFPTFTWKPDPSKFYSPSVGDLAIVAFLQDEVTRLVYQTEIVLDLNDPVINVVTGIEALLPEQVNVFPNPANREFVVELPGIVQNDIELQLVDQIGRIHPAGKIPAGKNSQTVDAGELAEGIYILQIGSGSNGAVRKKVMIVRKD